MNHHWAQSPVLPKKEGQGDQKHLRSLEYVRRKLLYPVPESCFIAHGLAWYLSIGQEIPAEHMVE